MGWTHQQGHVHKGKQVIRRGGTFLAVQERWRAEMHKVESASRGWGRYVIREMLGKSGASMVVVSLYLPTRSGAKEPGGGAWDWQVQQMVNLKARLQRAKEGAGLERWRSTTGGCWTILSSWTLWRLEVVGGGYSCQSGTAGLGDRAG